MCITTVQLCWCSDAGKTALCITTVQLCWCSDAGNTALCITTVQLCLLSSSNELLIIIVRFFFLSIIADFLQMFHCLLQANGIEGRGTVRKVIDVLTPALPHRIEDGLSLMLHWTKQVLVEEGHSAQQLVHILYVTQMPTSHNVCTSIL